MMVVNLFDSGAKHGFYFKITLLCSEYLTGLRRMMLLEIS